LSSCGDSNRVTTNGNQTNMSGNSGQATTAISPVSFELRDSRMDFPYGTAGGTDFSEEFDILIGNHTSQILAFDEIEAVFFTNDVAVTASTCIQATNGLIRTYYSGGEGVVSPFVDLSDIGRSWQLDPQTGEVVTIEAANVDFARTDDSAKSVALTLVLQNKPVYGPVKLRLPTATSNASP
jgi:hypothetical protein